MGRAGRRSSLLRAQNGPERGSVGLCRRSKTDFIVNKKLQNATKMPHFLTNQPAKTKGESILQSP